MNEITGVNQAVPAQNQAAEQTPETGPAPAPREESPAGQMPGQEFDSDLFLQLLVTQLRYQDPMSEQQDTGDMITQLTMFTLVEQVNNLQEVVEEQAESQGNHQALNLLNRQVEISGKGEGENVHGIVSAVEFRSSGPYLTVGEHQYPLSDIVKVEGGGSEDG